MPKEYIECADFGRRVPLAGPEGEPIQFGTVDTTAVKVGWTRDRDHVDLAVVNCDNGKYDDLAAQHLSLDRAGINRLIRTLRRARDAAFGADA